jgi:hypothetical protein
MQTTMKLEDPIYFNQRAWIALMKEVSINNLQTLKTAAHISVLFISPVFMLKLANVNMHIYLTMLFYVSEQQRRQRA